MVEFQRIEELGLADFVAMLLVETLDSIVAAHASQEERLRALEETASQDLEVFAATAITDDLIGLGLLESFPDGRGGTTINVGGPVPDTEALEALNLELEAADIDANKLTSAGVEKIRQAVRLLVARQNLESLQKVARQGVPRVRVDGGVLRSKLTFSAIQRGAGDADDQRVSARATAGTEPHIQSLRMPEGLPGMRMPQDPPGADPTPHAPEPSDPKPSEPQPSTPVPEPDIGPIKGIPVGGISWPMLPGLYKSIMDSIQKTRLTVRPAEPKPPPSGEPTQESSTTIYGEVEIHFHTEL